MSQKNILSPCLANKQRSKTGEDYFSGLTLICILNPAAQI